MLCFVVFRANTLSLTEFSSSFTILFILCLFSLYFLAIIRVCLSLLTVIIKVLHCSDCFAAFFFSCAEQPLFVRTQAGLVFFCIIMSSLVFLELGNSKFLTDLLRDQLSNKVMELCFLA